MKCMKRQKVVDRSTGNVRYRCMNKKCDLKGQDVSNDTCSKCKFTVVKHKRECGKPAPTPASAPTEEKEYPSLGMQLMSYKEAIMRWNRAGKPKRSDAEVNFIIENFCKGCSWYDSEKKRCKGCGCKVTTNSMAIINKVRMATEHCPRNYW